MSSYLLGTDNETRQRVYVPATAFPTHFHLIGGTGKGKTTAIHTLLRQMWRDPFNKSSFVIVDRMGNLSQESLLWLNSPFCPQWVRDRLVYIEAANENVVIPFNPLLYDTEQHGYFKVQRATDIILRAWAAQDLGQMPRLARWTFNSFWAAAQLGLTIADCVHLLLPGSQYHDSLLGLLPRLLQTEWSEIHKNHGQDADRILESTRNRLKPFFESAILRNMFGSVESRLDVSRFMREGKIVLIDLAPKERLSPQLTDAIGGLVINEILSAARSLPPTERYPTYVLLDEFQNFVGPDIASAIPEMRQLGVYLLLSHQSLSQLKRGDHDLTDIIFTCQSRMVFGLKGEDAEFLARELAAETYDPHRVKEERKGKRQRIKGHEIVELCGWSEAEQEAENWTKSWGDNWADQRKTTYDPKGNQSTLGTGRASGGNRGEGEGGANSKTRSASRSQHMVPIHEEVEEVVSRTFYSFEEWKNMWGRDIRQRRMGNCFMQLVNDPRVYDVAVQRMAAAYLSWSAEEIARKLPQVQEGVERLKELNFGSEFFRQPAVIEREREQRITRVIGASALHASSSAKLIGDEFE